jgi:hypothetical protein
VILIQADGGARVLDAGEARGLDLSGKSKSPAPDPAATPASAPAAAKLSIHDQIADFVANREVTRKAEDLVRARLGTVKAQGDDLLRAIDDEIKRMQDQRAKIDAEVKALEARLQAK